MPKVAFISDVLIVHTEEGYIMSAPTNIRIQRLQAKVANLQTQLDKMTAIADGFNIQLRNLHAVLGHTEFNRIVNLSPEAVKVVTMLEGKKPKPL